MGSGYTFSEKLGCDYTNSARRTIRPVDEADSPTPEERRAHAEEARRERLLRSISDMDDAAVAARWLHETYPAGFDDFRLRIVMETGLFVTYARPFTEGRGNPPLPVAPTTGLTDEQRRIHAWAIERRKKSAAHGTATTLTASSSPTT
jgi:hypothetical protein